MSAREIPLVSVIVRSMDRATLMPALASIAAQDYPSIEVVVVAARGREHRALPAQCGAHPLKFVTSDAPLRRPEAGNAGLDAFTGQWFTFLDDDDCFQPTHLALLVDAAHDASDVQVVYSLARAVFADGHQQVFGQPYSLIELYERNYIHLSTALIARGVLGLGCRFDTALDLHEDWDFFLQVAQRGPFHHIGAQAFEWHVEAGDSGGAAGRNHDAARFALLRDHVYAKWAPQRDALIDRVRHLLQQAGAAAQCGELAKARALCGEVLAASPGDPFGLNLLAMIERQAGRLPQARAMQQAAIAVRPQDANLVYNLALICRDLRDWAGAHAAIARAAAMEAGNPVFRQLQASLPPLSGPLN